MRPRATRPRKRCHRAGARDDSHSRGIRRLGRARCLVGRRTTRCAKANADSRRRATPAIARDLRLDHFLRESATASRWIDRARSMAPSRASMEGGSVRHRSISLLRVSARCATARTRSFCSRSRKHLRATSTACRARSLEKEVGRPAGPLKVPLVRLSMLDQPTSRSIHPRDSSVDRAASSAKTVSPHVPTAARRAPSARHHPTEPGYAARRPCSRPARPRGGL
jgi:hypothetical protein